MHLILFGSERYEGQPGNTLPGISSHIYIYMKDKSMCVCMHVYGNVLGKLCLYDCWRNVALPSRSSTRTTGLSGLMSAQYCISLMNRSPLLSLENGYLFIFPKEADAVFISLLR